MKIAIYSAFMFVWMSFAEVAESEIIYKLIESNAFVGEVTDIVIYEGWEEVFKGGDVGPGTKLEGNFELYDIGEEYGSLFLVSEYTFFGYTRSYTFEITADPTAHQSGWGTLGLYPGDKMSVSWYNNFDSDGLEETFHNYKTDVGGFFVDFNDYNKSTINGGGFFGWEGYDVYFTISPPATVNEPSVIYLWGTALLLSFLRFRRST